MTPHLVVRVDGDTFAVAHRGDLRDSMSRAMDTAMPDPGSTVHVAIVEASDAGSARLTRVAYWVGPDDTDPDTVHETVRALVGAPPYAMDRSSRYRAHHGGADAFDVAAITEVASALVDELRAWSGDAS
jgi:hypothetical protein